MNNEKSFEIGEEEYQRIKESAFQAFGALFPQMALPRVEISSICEKELDVMYRESNTPIFDEFKIRQLFDKIMKEMELRWNLDERFKPPAWKKRGGATMGGMEEDD